MLQSTLVEEFNYMVENDCVIDKNVIEIKNNITKEESLEKSGSSVYNLRSQR